MRILITTLYLLISTVLHAETSKTFGEYEVYYTVLNSTFISPEVAKTYNIVRGKDRALINIAVRKNMGKGLSRAKKSLVTGETFDLIHTKALKFKEIVEQDAIYYIAELSFNNKELLTYTIHIQPDPNISPYTLKFSKKLYVDE